MLAAMSIVDLNRTLTASKWALGIFAVLTALAGLFNQWVTDEITRLQSAQKAEAQLKLEKSEAELRETKKRTAQLEARLAPRSLTPEQQRVVVAAVTSFAGTQFQFTSYQDNAEVKGLVVSLIKLLLDAGWKGLPAQDFLMDSLVEGVVVEYAPASRGALAPAAAALVDSLNSQGITAEARENPELKDFADRIKIKVGKKPS